MARNVPLWDGARHSRRGGLESRIRWGRFRGAGTGLRRAAALLPLGAIALLPTPASAAELELVSQTEVNPRLLQLEFTTPAMPEGAAAARVLLPPGYDESKRDYPVLYLLHGAGYDETGWTTDGRAEEILGQRKVIVVMPNGGGNGYYTDWYNGGAFGPPAYETFHVGQLLPWIDDNFRTRAERDGRAVAGFSMAGFGAMSYAARHPHLFSGAFSFSGAIDTNYPPFQAVGEASSLADGGQYAAIFGQRQSEEVRWRAKNPWDLATNLEGMTLEIRTGNGMGGGDFGGPPFDPIEFGVHEMALSMDQRLTALGIPHVLEDYGPGAHEFPYYSRSLARSLPGIMGTFRHPPAVPRRFTHRAVEPSYRAHRYRVSFDRDVLEFSELDGMGNGRELVLRGSGTAEVATRVRRRTRYAVSIEDENGSRKLLLRTGRKGRLRFQLSLGPANPAQQYTAEAAAAGAEVREASVVLARVPARRRSSRSTSADRRAEIWKPDLRDRWQYQLEGGRIDVDVCKQPFTGGDCVRPDVFDIDLYGADGETLNATAVDAIHARGGHAVCYVSAGTAERFRPDYRKYVKFDKSVGGKLIGKPFSDRFSDENWLDIGPRKHRRFVLKRLEARTRLCAEAGFDGIEYDNIETYVQSRKTTGFKVTASEQLTFNFNLAEIAHDYGLAAGLKNDLGQLEALEPSFDFAVNESCFRFNECTNNPPPGYRTFLEAGKPVFQVEYGQDPKGFCPDANALGVSSIVKARDLSLRAEPWISCR